MNRIGQIVGLWVLLGLLVLGIGAIATLVKYLCALGVVPCIIAGGVLFMCGSYAAIRMIAK